METFQSGPYRIERRDDFSFVIPPQGGMRTEGIIFLDREMFLASLEDGCPIQVANVAHLPGIVGPSIAMPDIHSGYGFPIGGVAAFDAEGGVVSPGGVGYDINCGVRLLVSGLERGDLGERGRSLLEAVHRAVPAGVGSKRPDLGKGKGFFEACLVSGAEAAVEAGFGAPGDLDRIEGRGRIEGADPGRASSRALGRGMVQLGTLGSGNHFVEVGVVDDLLDEEAGRAFGLEPGRVTVTIHTGSRGFGHQVCEDTVRSLRNAPAFKSLDLPDRQLCCAPIRSGAGKAYLAAMAAAANFAFANRQIITQGVREAFEKVFRGAGLDATLHLLYDLTHNIARFEEHTVAGRRRRLLVHRKGATRSLPPGHPELVPPAFRRYGQPVIVPGDMGRSSFVLVGASPAGESGTFLSSAHGAGRVMSRKRARSMSTAGEVLARLGRKGILVRSASRGTVAEEAPGAYKDVERVVHVLERAGIARPVARLRPLLVVKG